MLWISIDLLTTEHTLWTFSKGEVDENLDISHQDQDLNLLYGYVYFESMTETITLTEN